MPDLILAKGRSASRFVLFVIVIGTSVALATGLAYSFSLPRSVEGAGVRLERLDRVRTGPQRAESLTFMDQGRRLAVACPRYNRVVVYRIHSDAPMERDYDIRLEGRPVALAATDERLIVLQRPAGDARHVEEAWWDEFALDGTKAGTRFRVGFDPDDLAISPDARTAVVLRSGRSEGEGNRPPPGLLVVDRSTEPPREVASLEFPQEDDDPERLAWDASTGRAWVALRDSRDILSVDLSDTRHPRIVRRVTLASPVAQPSSLVLDSEGTVWLADGERGGLWSVRNGSASDRIAKNLVVAGVYRSFGVVGADSRGNVAALTSGKGATRLPLSRLGDFRPMAMASCERPEGRWLAVSDRSGSVELIRMSFTAR